MCQQQGQSSEPSLSELIQGQSSEPSLSELIQGLPPELREMICKEYLAVEKRQREVLSQQRVLGLDEVHDELLCAPFCGKKWRNTKVVICRKCDTCEKNRLCTVCLSFGEKHYIDPLLWNSSDCDEEFYENHIRYM